MTLAEIFSSWQGSVELDGIKFDSVSDVDFNAVNDDSCIILHCNNNNSVERTTAQLEINSDKEYTITVRAYMTRTGSPSFDFMTKWNNDIPMPLRTMVGTFEKETKGMVYAKLHGDIIGETVQTCMKCGRPITNAVSKFFGMGPECGKHNYINPFKSEEELQQVVQDYRKNYLQNITWEGWIIKSAIISQEEFNKGENINETNI